VELMTELREVRMIVPYTAPLNADRWLKDRLLDHFGGYTCFHVVGGWRSPEGADHSEGGVAYDVAVPDRPESDWLLLEVVNGLFERSEEQAVYVRMRDGTICVVDRPSVQSTQIAA
jgi:hypothetical protein